MCGSPQPTQMLPKNKINNTHQHSVAPERPKPLLAQSVDLEIWFVYRT